jgi:iron-only hydrogenase group A
MKIQITIDNKKIKTDSERSILEIALENGIEIPHLCYHQDLEMKAGCRLCLVKISEKLVTSCNTKARDGMIIKTNTSQIKKAVVTNLELIFSQHSKECYDCVWRFNCELLNYARKYKINTNKYTNRKLNYPIYSFNNCIEFDTSKCIDCLNCVEVCKNQGVGFLKVRGRGHLQEVTPCLDNKVDCVYCGQCILHCPVGAFESVGEFEKIENPFLEKNKIKIVQIAPSVRASIGEELNYPYDSSTMGKMVAVLKELGADYVFDVSSGADFTTIEEAKELIFRIRNKGKLPMITSCCPSWVKFIEFFYPEFIPNLTSVRSPQILMGGLIKNYWSKEKKVKPEEISVISIMPCVSKKHEITKKELRIDKIYPVDHVLTVRELVRLIKNKKIDFKKIKPINLDNPFGDPSGSGVIYGSSGGVMESALRTAHKMLTQKEIKIKFKELRGFSGIKESKIKINNKILNVLVVNGLGNAKEILDKLKKNKNKYHYIEVMACPGGCIGGGGQPIPSNNNIKKKRANVLYSIDSKSKKKLAEDNPLIKKIYTDYLNNEKIIKKICHTKYKKIKKQKLYNKKI